MMTEAKTHPSHASASELISRHRGAIMGFAAIWILVFHEWITVFDDHPTLFSVEYFIKAIGFCGVDIFLFLSGMGLCRSIKKGSLPSFYLKRLKRVIVPFLIVAVLRAVTEGWDLVLFIKRVSGYSFFAVNMYELLWFVPAILVFYLLFPLYHKLMELSKDPTLFTCAALCVWLLITMISGYSGSEIIKIRYELYGFTNRIPVFLIGILFGKRSETEQKPFRASGRIACFAALVLGLYLAYLANFCQVQILVPLSNCCIPNLLIAVSLSFLLSDLFEAISRVRFIRGIEKFFGFFGLFSLQFYCIQEWLTDNYLHPFFRERLPNVVTNLLVFVIVTAAALVMYLAEKGLWSAVDKIKARVSRKKADKA